MKTSALKLFALPLMAILWMAGFGFADLLNNNEVQFTGAIESVVVNGEGMGTLFVRLDTIGLRVIVNPRTMIQDFEGDFITIDDLEGLAEQALSADPPEEIMIEVTGKFSSSGILATRVRVTEEPMDFNIRGHITRITMLSEDTAQISLLGITIFADLAADPPTSLQRDGVDVPLSELKIGTKIQATGSISPDDGSWNAAEIQILTNARRNGLAIFEGTIETYDEASGTLTIVVAGAETSDPTTVHIKNGTRIFGTIATGAYVMVIGKINPDYSFDAKEIRVLAALEIKPDELKMREGETVTLTVKLREPAPAGGVTIELSVPNNGVLSLSDDTITIPEDGQSGEFTVTALGPGTETITASISDASPPETATALVKVRQLMDDDAPPPAGQTRIYFSPDHLKLKPNDSREVVLHIHPPHLENVEITYESSDEEIVPLPMERVLSNGAAMFKVLIQSTGKTGTGILVTATLPEDLGGGQAQLEVTIEDKKSK